MTDMTSIIARQSPGTYPGIPAGLRDLKKDRKAEDILIAEGGVSFYNYLRKLGVEKDPDMIVISSLRHFYYDTDDMSRAVTLLNLTELNYVKRIADFLDTCYQIMPHESYLIGCFIDNKNIPRYKLRNSSASNVVKRDLVAIENGIISSVPFINRFYSVFDSRTNTYMTKRSVSAMLEDNGFKVLDMTDLDGQTYFQTQKTRSAYKFAARAY